MTNLKGIHKYTYERELGFGCFSYVSLARNKHNKQLYAIKCFQLEQEIPEHLIPPLFYINGFCSVINESQFNDEVRLHTLFNSKSIGPILYTNWVKDGLGYMVLEVWDRALEVGDVVSKVHISKIENQITQSITLGMFIWILD